MVIVGDLIPERLAQAESFGCETVDISKGVQMILNDKAHIAMAVNAKVISLDEALQGYSDFDSGVAEKFVLDPHGLIKAA